MTKKKVPLKPHILKSKMGLFRVDDAWLLVYPHPLYSHQLQETFSDDDNGIVELLWTIKDNIMGHYNSKHNEYNIIIKRVKVKK
jgi:hypothetical protein